MGSSGKWTNEILSRGTATSANITLSPNLAHQVIWNHFVNLKGGTGKTFHVTSLTIDRAFEQAAKFHYYPARAVRAG